MKEYYSYVIQQRNDQGNTLLHGGRLFQEYLVDAFTAVEEHLLKWTRNNQDTLRVDLYNKVCDAVTRGDTNVAGLGKRIVLPNSFTGGPRYMMQNYQDAMALCRVYGNPDLFITFTSNPKWAEITEMLLNVPGQKAHNRPEVGTRVFKMKLSELLDDITKKQIFVESCAVVYVIEFQKRGLPHAHILLWLEEDYKCKTGDQINDLISAELPCPINDPVGYNVVTEYMIHGPCGKDAKYAPCHVEGKCSKHYPKPFFAKTVIDDNGYPIYRRRDNKIVFKKGKVVYDNRNVVPHNRYLLLKYKAHINVEWCNRSKAIKYLFKYLNKGPDRATIVIQENVHNGNHVTAEQLIEVDEIKNYLNCRYMAPCEAVWRLFSFDIHYSYPSVMTVNFHLKNQNPVKLRDSESLPALLEKEDIDVTMFTNWFKLNERDEDVCTLTYAQIPEHYVWHDRLKLWQPRKQRKVIGRIVYSSPASRERYYLRMILNVARGPEAYEELMSVNNKVYGTFKEACFAYGLLSDDKEWTHAVSKASVWAFGPQLRDIFVTILLFCEELLNRNGRSLVDFQDLPKPNPKLLTNTDNRLIREALAFDMQKSKVEHERLHSLLNLKQRLIYEDVIDSVHNKNGKFYFLYGPGVTGKTFVYNTIIARLRSERRILLAVASSGIASLLLPAGRTAHSRFVILLELLENSTCGIKQNTHLAALMQEVQLINSDEAPMTQKFAFEALDKTLKDILGYKQPANRDEIFRGMTVLLGGDFRQILHVIPKGKRADIVQSSINRSELWKFCKVFTLTCSMRVNEYYANEDIDTRKQEFNRWILDVGDGKIPAKIKDGEDEATWIDIPERFLIKSWNCPIEQIVAKTYPGFTARKTDGEYLKERAILTPRNDDADKINKYMFDKLDSQEVIYNCADEICKASTDTLDQHSLYPIEFLSSLNFSDLGQFVIHARILTGSHVGDDVVIHRIILTSTQSKWPFV